MRGWQVSFVERALAVMREDLYSANGPFIIRPSMNKIIAGVLILLICGGVLYFIQSGDGALPRAVVIKGSDTEVQLVSNLVEAFLEKNPDANISVTGGGSGAGIAALINGEIDVANSSRSMKEEELRTAKNNGYAVREFVLARDGLSVIVHSSSPIRTLTLEQVGKIYRGEITDWKEAGGAPGKIILYGRQSTSGTYVFFRDTVLKDDYAKEMLNMEGSQAIVDGVAADTQGIGYVGVGYAKDETGKARADIGVLSIAKDSASSAVSPLDKGKVLSGDYPIFRPIYQYLAALPEKGSTLEALLRFEVSTEGEEILEATGFYPLIAEDKAKNSAVLEALL